MTTWIRGKKRTQIIENWLKGVENPDVEVKPTRNEDRYIVKAKSKENREEDIKDSDKDSTSERSERSKRSEHRVEFRAKFGRN